MSENGTSEIRPITEGNPSSERVENILRRLPEKDRQALVPLLHPERVKEALASLSSEEKEVLRPLIYEEVETTSLYYGPLPPPEVLSQYEVLVPGSAKEMIEIYNETNRAEIDLTKEKMTKVGRGQIMGFFIALFFGAISLIAALNGHDTYAEILGGATVVSLAVIFVLGQKPGNNAKQKKANSRSDVY